MSEERDWVKKVKTVLTSISFCLLAALAAAADDVPSAADCPEAMPKLLELLDSKDDLTVILAYRSLREYYCHPPNWRSEGPVPVVGRYFDREPLQSEVRSWQVKFHGKSRKQILLMRLEEEPTYYVLEYVPKVFPRDEAMDYLIDWVLSDRKSRACGLSLLRDLTGLNPMGDRIPNKELIAFASSYWKQVKSLNHDDLSRLQAIGRLLVRQSEGWPVCKRLKESGARKIFLEDETRSIHLWRQLYDLMPRWGDALQGTTETAVEGNVASRQYELCVALAKVNSSQSIALLTKLGKEHESLWFRDCVRNLLHNVESHPESVMEEPVSRDGKQ